VVVLFGLDDGDGDVRFVVQDVVREFGLSTRDHLSANVDLTLGEVHLASNLSRFVPASLLHVANVAPAAVSKAPSQTDTYYVSTTGCLHDVWWNPNSNGNTTITCGVANI
jgi:hypothetical protein